MTVFLIGLVLGYCYYAFSLLARDFNIRYKSMEWVLSKPGLVITGLLLQPLHIALLSALILVMPIFGLIIILSPINWLFFKRRIDKFRDWTLFVRFTVGTYLDFYSKLYESWCESIGIRTVRYNINRFDRQLSEGYPQGKALMVYAIRVSEAEKENNTRFSPKEQCIYLLTRYLNQGSESLFFKKAKPHAAFVKTLLQDLQTNDSTIEDMDFKLDAYKTNHGLDQELLTIAEYVQHVLVPMEDKAVYQANPTVAVLKQKVPILMHCDETDFTPQLESQSSSVTARS